MVARAEPFVPTNLYPIERLPNYFNRVITLPCYYSDENSGMLKYIDDIFHQELTQERIFETIRINTKQMKEYFGTERVSSSGELPESFLRTLEDRTSANGVLFVDLHSYLSLIHI